MTRLLRAEAEGDSVQITPPRVFNRRIIAFFALLLVIEWFLYFRHARHFFQADSIFLLCYRMTSIGGVLHQFFRLHASGWYRPLANDVFEYALYPFLGLNPVGYRIPVYAFFISSTIAAYAVVFAITRRELAAVIGTFFYAVHTVGGYVTFDLGLLPDLMYTFFYLLAVLGYLSYLERGSKSAFRISLVCFTASLLSKEAAVTLPGVLVVLYVVMTPKPEAFRSRIIPAFKSCAAHILILCLYLAFVVGNLNVQRFSTAASFEPPKDGVSGGYYLSLDRTILSNADLAMTFAMNMPRGYWGHWRNLTPRMLGFLKVFRAMLVVLMVPLLTGRNRNKVLLGIAWFFLALVPSLPLVDHFLLNYLFLPLVGLAIIVGMAFAQLYDVLRRFQPAVAAIVVTAIFAGLLYVCDRSIRNDIRSNRLLGGSAEIASTSLNDLKRMYPKLPPKVTLFFADNEDPVSWEHASGKLLKLAYDTQDFSTLYASLGENLVPDESIAENTILLKYHNKHLVDETAAMRKDPLGYLVENDLIRYENSSVNKLALSKTEASIGESYTLSVSGLHDANIRVAYKLNDGGIELFKATLDANGRTTFDVTAETRKGLYRFFEFNIDGHAEWIRGNTTITIR